MNNCVGVLATDNLVFDAVRSNLGEVEIVKHHSADSIRDNVSVLIVDLDVFEDCESIQFFLSKIRKKIHNLPVILLINQNNKDRVCFDWFFDDFVYFPLRKGELELRLKRFALVSKDENENIITVGKITINLEAYAVYYEDEKVDFTYKEFELLRLFLTNKGHVFSRKDLLAKIWGLEYIGGTRTVDVHIRRLRSKLGEDFNSLIETVRNVGYCCVK